MPTPEPVLHFYPGHFPVTRTSKRTGATLSPGLLIVLRGTQAVYQTKAWGGPSKRTPDLNGGPDMTPTPQGTFVLMKPEPYYTGTWKFSELRWGTKLKDEVTHDDVLYALPVQHGAPERWASMKRDFHITRADVLDYHETLYGSRIVPATWIFNAFGPLAVRYFRDLNGNRKLDKDKGEKLDGSMFHTTAENEAEVARGQTPNMGNSHGCIHLQPADRTALISSGVLKAGMLLVIHGYSEHYGAATIP